MKAPVGVILAGGRSRRMGGGDKALLPFGTGTLLDAVIARLAPQVSALALSANGDAARFARFGLPVLPDGDPAGQGPLSGVLAALDWAVAQGATHLVTVPADAPFLPCDLVPRLILAGEGGPGAAIAASDRPHGTFALWPVTCRDRLAAALRRGERRVMAFATAEGAGIASFPPPDPGADWPDPFLNVNTPEDLARARAAL